MTYVPGRNERSRGIDPTPRGPIRWERAARNAIRHPMSQAAGVYFARYSVAREIAQAAGIVGRVDVPYEFVYPTGPTLRREYCTCSVFCTILQITLIFGTVDKEQIARVFASSQPRNAVRQLDRHTLTRDVRCQVCGSQIKRKVA